MRLLDALDGRLDRRAHAPTSSVSLVTLEGGQVIMDRWQYLSNMPPPPGEKEVHKQGGVRLYDGDSRSSFDDSYIDFSLIFRIYKNLKNVTLATVIPRMP